MKTRTSAFRSSFASLLFTFLAAFHVSAQSPMELTSIGSTTNGVVLVWTNLAPGYAYTVQIRDSWAAGAWRSASTRYRWPWPATRWADPPRNLPGNRFYRVVAEAVAAPRRGKLLSPGVQQQISTNTLKSDFVNWGISSFVQPRFGIVKRPFTYETVDPFSLPIIASALLILPRVTNGPLPLFSYQHGTQVLRADAPSQGGSELVWAEAFASAGYAVVVPDYLGLGASPGYQAYLHAKSGATCVVDALRAARALCDISQVTLTGQLFLTGYSQGGHVTMATHRELEALHADEFTVTASAPCAGPYDLGGTIDELLSGRPYPNPWYFGMIWASYLAIYHLGDTLEEILAEPYRHTLPPLLDGTHSWDQLAGVMPADMFETLRADVQRDFRTNVNNPLRQAFLDNNTYAWTPKAPLRMFHCRGDRDVIYANAEVAYQSFKNRGACCVSIVDPGAPEELAHGPCYLPSLRAVMAWFDGFR